MRAGVVLVCGATERLGRALVDAFSGRGDRVVRLTDWA
jgi:NAD(P)-dependent dehydrogenase (short-subunit alcohol dehydrogenase family)